MIFAIVLDDFIIHVLIFPLNLQTELKSKNLHNIIYESSPTASFRSSNGYLSNLIMGSLSHHQEGCSGTCHLSGRHVPRLPNRLWVTYHDGYSEFRQVKWMNGPLSVEQEEADVRRTPVGSHYRLKGYIVGDATTDNGYPVEATIDVVKDDVQPPRREKAFTFPLSDVTIHGTSRLTHNRDEALREICSWDVSQQLYNYRDTYNMPTEGYKCADGWDSRHQAQRPWLRTLYVCYRPGLCCDEGSATESDSPKEHHAYGQRAACLSRKLLCGTILWAAIGKPATSHRSAN